MKHLTLLLLLSLITFSCTEECCEDGQVTNPDDIKEVINENENQDPLFSALINGNLSCLNDSPIADVTVTATDETGNTTTTQTDANGDFGFSSLTAGSYVVSFDNPNLHSYTGAEYDFLINDLYDIILNVKPNSTAHEIAYHMINLDDGLTTYDRLLFERLMSGEMQVSEVDTPWRYVTQDDLDLDNVSITKNLSFTITQGEELDLVVKGIQYGDPTGATCN